LKKEKLLAPIFLQVPDAFHLIGVFLFGALLASFANYCVDRLGWYERYRSPWRRFPEKLSDKGPLPVRTWQDRVPIWGWLSLSRFPLKKAEETSRKKGAKNRVVAPAEKQEREATWEYAWIPGWESRFFWVRPFLVEILFAALIAWRYSYWFSVSSDAPSFSPLAAWGVETVLFWLALCASLVDLDDYVIPDMLMTPGILLGLCAAVLFPWLLTPIAWPLDWTGEKTTFSISAFVAHLLASNGAEVSLGSVRACVGGGLSLAWTFWSFALLDRRFYLRLGVRRAFALFWRRLRRSPLTPIVVGLWVLGLVGIWLVVCKYASLDFSERAFSFNALDSLVCAFVGLLVGAILIWAVRLIGGAALGVEAMGFGDVILMGMLGAFIGWQGAVVVFFIAPFFGLVFGLARRCFDSAHEIPYGPFLCLGTLTYVLWREQFDLALKPYFSDPLFAFGLGVVGFVLLGVLLGLLRVVKGLRR
jgi:leader peptidase (prepilin peptidase)/N-methyltransferase